jgi:fumarate reductase subunit D
LGKFLLFIVISLALWHAAHRLRVVFHDFGVRMDKTVARAVYLLAAIGTLMTAFYLNAI